MVSSGKGRFEKSDILYRRAEAVIPTATQTFSKSRIQFPAGFTPDFLDRGEGGVVWDVDGNRYVDMIMGLLCNLLGYRDPDVDAAVRSQLDKGISFSLATTLEMDVAEQIVNLVPCAEMVRFGKNGTDATSAAVRVSRAATGRNHILALGYHGWQDWYVGATVRNKGVPSSVSGLTRKLPFNDLQAVKSAFDELNDDVACVILEPMSAVEPLPGYLEELRRFTEQKGCLLVFDETITGFRFAKGGAQELFGVTPDLCTLGKGLANGMPLSAIAGRADLMREFEEIFFSGTFGGEALSLAAAKAVIDKIEREPVIATLWERGGWLMREVNVFARRHGLADAVSLAGKAPWPIMSFKAFGQATASEVQTFAVRSMIEKGVLFGGSLNICYAHKDEDLKAVLTAFDEMLTELAIEVQKPNLADRMGCSMIEPVFKVRG